MSKEILSSTDTEGESGVALSERVKNKKTISI